MTVYLPPLDKLPQNPTTHDWDRHSSQRIARLEEALKQMTNLAMMGDIPAWKDKEIRAIFKEAMKR